MPQIKNKLDEQDEISSDEISHKKVKTDAEGNGTALVEKNGNGKEEIGVKDDKDDEEIIDGVSSEVQAEEKQDNNTTKEETGVLLICGGVNWDLVGRKELPKAQRNAKNVSATAKNLWGPALWTADVKLRSVHSFCGAAHSVIITEDYKAYVFGRNDKNQLGFNDTDSRHEPVLLESLSKYKVLSAAVGKNHTLFLTDNGVYACGDNKLGQCGVGNQNATITTPTRVNYNGQQIVKMACGGDFSMILDSLGSLYSFGSPEFGQLGHNSEGKYFTTGNKIAFNCELSPRKIMCFIEKSREGHVIQVDGVKITDIACGINHALAIDTKNRCFSWGFAGYGRLGHNDTKNEMVPRNLKSFDYQNKGLAKVYAGSTFSMGVDVNGVLYFWGQTKSTGEATMYPKPQQELGGWNIRSVGCANKSIVICADSSVISYGPSPTFGELGYGENKARSSTVPQEVRTLEGIYVHGVSCGYSHTLFLARAGDNKELEKIQKLPKWSSA